jgi:DNA polymerase-4
LWGVGPKGEKRLHARGLYTVGDLAALSEITLAGYFGETGRHLWRLANGIDDRSVIADREAKSLSTETTFETDLDDRDVLRRWLLNLVDHLVARIRHSGLKGRTIHLKVRSSAFRTRTKSRTLSDSTDVTDIIWHAAADLLQRSLTPDMLPVRLLGIGISNLTRSEASERDLFATSSTDRQASLDNVVDAIRDQFGSGAIRRGLAVDAPDRKRKSRL